MRIDQHPILGEDKARPKVKITVDGVEIEAVEGEPIAAALLANNIKVFRFTDRFREARSIYCGIGQCTDCKMIVDGVPNVKTCVTPVREGMVIQTQQGRGSKYAGN